MHPVALYILVWLGGAVVGALSAAIVFGLWWLVSRRLRVRLEMMFGVCGLVGFAMMFAGRMIDSRGLSAASVALWGWVIVPVVAIPVLVLWRLAAWCRRRIAG